MIKGFWWVLASFFSWIGVIIFVMFGLLDNNPHPIFTAVLGGIGFFLLGVLCLFNFWKILKTITPKKFEEMLAKVIKVSSDGYIIFEVYTPSHEAWTFKRHISELSPEIVYRIKKGDRFYAQIGIVPGTKAKLYAHSWEKKI